MSRPLRQRQRHSRHGFRSRHNALSCRAWMHATSPFWKNVATWASWRHCRFVFHRWRASKFAKHVQRVLTGRSELMKVRNYGVLSPSTWRLADLLTKHPFQKDGVGWGSIPLHLVKQDIADGKMFKLKFDDTSRTGSTLAMYAFYPASAMLEPAARWFVEDLRTWSGNAFLNSEQA